MAGCRGNDRAPIPIPRPRQSRPSFPSRTVWRCRMLWEAPLACAAPSAVGPRRAVCPARATHRDRACLDAPRFPQRHTKAGLVGVLEGARTIGAALSFVNMAERVLNGWNHSKNRECGEL